MCAVTREKRVLKGLPGFKKEALKTVSQVERRFYVRHDQHILKLWIFRVKLRRTWDDGILSAFQSWKLTQRGDWVSCFAQLSGGRIRCCISRASGPVTRLHCFLFRPFHPEESKPLSSLGGHRVYIRALRHRLWWKGMCSGARQSCL